VADDGPGVEDAVLPRLFSPVNSTKGSDHSGLGLSIVHRLVQEMGGSIRYGRSARLGGAEFTLLLPMRPAGGKSSPQQDG
jgi:signal transduction histidine kinase